MLWNIDKEIKKIDDQVENLVVPTTGSNLGSAIQSHPSLYGSITITDSPLKLQSNPVSFAVSEHCTKSEVLDLLREVLLAYDEHSLSSAMSKIEDIRIRGL